MTTISFNKLFLQDIVNHTNQQATPQLSTESTSTSSSFDDINPDFHMDSRDYENEGVIRPGITPTGSIAKFIDALDSLKEIVEDRKRTNNNKLHGKVNKKTSSTVGMDAYNICERRVSIVCADQVKSRRSSDSHGKSPGERNAPAKMMTEFVSQNRHHHKNRRNQPEIYSTENATDLGKVFTHRERLSKRKEKVIVEVRVVFLKIGEIDTLKELYHADAFIQSKWREPRLDGKTPEELSQIDLQECWNPLIYIENILTESKEQHWILAQLDENNQTWVVERRRLRGVFLETLELNDFPLDVQDLTITLTSERPENEIDLIPDTSELCGINVQTFVDQQEWRLHEHIETTKRSVIQEYTNSSQSHSCISVTCRAARRPGYFYWNVFLIMFFITGLSFATFAVPADRPENRLQLSFTLFLTSVAFKFVINQSLPKISYLTYMDKYVLMSLGILCVISIWHASVTLIPVVAETRLKDILGLREYKLNDNRSEILKLFNVVEQDIPMNDNMFNLTFEDKSILKLSDESADEFINWAKMTNKIRKLTKLNEERIKSIELNVFGSFCVLYLIAHLIFVFWLYYDASKRRREMFEKDRQYKSEIFQKLSAMVGSSIFILTGTVIRNKAGPLTFLSYIIAGCVALPNSLIYAELACLIPKAGSTYIYSYVILYELIAFITGWSILLEYVISSSAVARACTAFIDLMSDNKISETFIQAFGRPNENNAILANYLDPLGCIFLLVMAMLSCFGIKSSAWVNNIMVGLNLTVILIITIYLYVYANVKNLYAVPPMNYTPPDRLNTIKYLPNSPTLLPFGIKGLIAGSATCFNAFIGFDVISTCAEETKNPGKSLPLANIIAVFLVTILLSLCSLSLILYVPWYLIDPEVPFSYALIHSSIGNREANTGMFYFVSIGALIGYLACLLGNIIAATRILYSMAEDKLVFACFKYVWADVKTPVYSTMLIGIVGGILTLIFSIESLADFLSLGTLIAYSIASMVIIKYRFTRPFDGDNEKKIDFSELKPDEAKFHYIKEPWAKALPNWLIKLLVNKRCHGKMPIFLLLSYIGALSMFLFTVNLPIDLYPANYIDIPRYIFMGIFAFLMCTFVFLMTIHKQKICPDNEMFWLPGVPAVPCIAIFCNGVLISQLTWLSWVRFVIWLGIGLLIYFGYGVFQDPNEPCEFDGEPVEGSTTATTMVVNDDTAKDEG